MVDSIYGIIWVDGYNQIVTRVHLIVWMVLDELTHVETIWFVHGGIIPA